MPKRSLYIAGPMSGREHYGFPAFDEAEARLISDGWIVRSPADHDRSLGFDPEGPPPDAVTLAEMHRWDMQTITESDAIYMLPGWEDSDGATRELDVARVCGLDVYWADDATPPYEADERPAPRQWEYPTCTSHPTAERTHWNGTTWTEPPSPEAEATLAEWQRKLDALPPYVPGAKLPVEPPDGEAMPPAPKLQFVVDVEGYRCLTCGLTGMLAADVQHHTHGHELEKKAQQARGQSFSMETPAVAAHAFNRAVDASVARTQAISGQRGETYQDTWSEANLRTSFLDATLRSIAEQQGHHGADIELAALTPAERRLIVVASLCDVKLSRLIGEWKQDHVDDLENYAGAWNTWMGEYLGQGEATA